ncbi:MAG: hypothetical protein ACI8W8_003831 [Rhodothermales bacterium]|jgi:hypothetical protein
MDDMGYGTVSRAMYPARASGESDRVKLLEILQK